MTADLEHDVILPPDPESLTQSLRGMGYTVETAIADIIDNSISAGARSIRVIMNRETEQSGASILIKDDGVGMSESCLITAMKLGSISPLKKRRENDLGRFGLGLKSASFSQCRNLTVVSKKDQQTSSFSWDLDEIVRTGEWKLQKSREIPPCAQIEGEHGTVVLWRKIDRIPFMSKDAQDYDWSSLRKKVCMSLGLIFHRFIADGLEIYFGDDKIKPIDPFFSQDPGKPCDFPRVFWPESGSTVKAWLQCYVVPMTSAMSQDEDGCLQGFYVYRGKRLLQAGGWLGLKDLRVEEQYRLARICLDFENDGDEEWQVDIKKSRARPPAEMRQWLRKYALQARTLSDQTINRQNAKEGRRKRISKLWRKSRGSAPLPDYTSPVMEALFSRLESGGLDAQVMRGFLEILAVSHPSWKGCQILSGEDFRKAIAAIYETMSREYGGERAGEILRDTDPFCNWPGVLGEICGGSYEQS